MHLVIFDKKHKNIVGYTTSDATLQEYYAEIPHLIDVHDSLLLEKIPYDWMSYKIINKKLVRMTKREMLEIRQYGRFLTEEERQLNKLKPSIEEIRKAEQTIEILTLIQEVI